MTAHMQAPARQDREVLGRAVVAPGGRLVVTGYRECSALLRDHRLRKAPERMLAASGYPDWQDRPSLRLARWVFSTTRPGPANRPCFSLPCQCSRSWIVWPVPSSRHLAK